MKCLELALDMSFGNDMIDNMNAIENYSAECYESITQYTEYIKKRSTIDEQYSKSLTRLNNSYLMKSNSNRKNAASVALEQIIKLSEYCSDSILQCSSQFHEIMITLKQNQKQYDIGKRAAGQKIKKIKDEWKQQLNSFECSCRKKETVDKLMDESRMVYERANTDRSLSKREIEKCRSEFSTRAKISQEYSKRFQSALDETLRQKSDFYTQTLPSALNQLQKNEEERIEFIKGSTKDLLNRVKELSNGITEKTGHILEFVNTLGSQEIASFIEQNRIPFNIPDLVVPEFKIYERPVKEMSRKRAIIELNKIEEEIQITEKKKSGIQVLIKVYHDQPSFSSNSNLVKMEAELMEINDTLKELTGKKNELEFLLGDAPRSIYTPSMITEDTQSYQPSIATFESDKTCTPSVEPSISTISWEETAFNHISTEQESESEVLVCLYDFDAEQGTEELSITEGEELTLIQKEGDWWKVKNEKGTSGFVPFNYVSIK